MKKLFYIVLFSPYLLLAQGDLNQDQVNFLNAIDLKNETAWEDYYSSSDNQNDELMGIYYIEIILHTKGQTREGVYDEKSEDGLKAWCHIKNDGTYDVNAIKNNASLFKIEKTSSPNHLLVTRKDIDDRGKDLSKNVFFDGTKFEISVNLPLLSYERKAGIHSTNVTYKCSKTFPINTNNVNNSSANPSEHNLLEQLEILGRLRDNGVLTEEEFIEQKKKLLGK